MTPPTVGSNVGRPSKLTAKQARFVEEYLVDLNATRAAIRAGYSEKTAAAVGCENLTKPNIADALAEAFSARSQRTEITQDMVVAELAGIAFTEVPEELIKVPDKIAALDKLGRHLGMFVQRHEHTGPHGGPITIEEANEAKERLFEALARIADRMIERLESQRVLGDAGPEAGTPVLTLDANGRGKQR